MKISLSTITDTLFTAFITFILAFLIFNYYFAREFALTFSFVSAGLISLVAFKFLSKRKFKFLTSKAERDAKNKMTEGLNLYGISEQTDFFQKAFIKANLSPERKRGYLYFKDKGVSVFCRFGFDGVTKTDIVKIFNAIKRTDIAYILAEKFSNELISFANRFDGRINLITAEEVYRFLLDNNCLPQEKFVLKESAFSKLKMLKLLLEKKKAKTHLIFGLTFLIMSYFVYFKVYYAVVGTIFLILSLFCRLFGTEKNPTQS